MRNIKNVWGMFSDALFYTIPCCILVLICKFFFLPTIRKIICWRTIFNCIYYDDSVFANRMMLHTYLKQFWFNVKWFFSSKYFMVQQNSVPHPMSYGQEFAKQCYIWRAICLPKYLNMICSCSKCSVIFMVPYHVQKQCSQNV